MFQTNFVQKIKTHILLIIIIGGILVIFICITRLVSKEIFSPSKKYIGK